jgi:hypothetical protein
MIFFIFLNSFVLIVRLPKQFLAKVLQSFEIFYFSGSTALNSISTRFSGAINLLILKNQ